MLLSLLDVFIGLAVVYLILSTVASLIVELVEVGLRRRGKLLAQCLGEIFALGDQGGSAEQTATAVAAFYNSIPIASLFPGTAVAAVKDGRAGVPNISQGKLPSYIPPERFAAAIQALALLPSSEPAAAVFSKLKSSVLAGIPLPTAEVDRQVAERQALAQYFEQSSDRFSGWYRRHVKLWLLASGLLLALLSNADTLRLVTTLSNDAQIRQTVLSQTLEHVREQRRTDWSSDCASMASAECESKLQSEIAAQLQLVDTLGLPLGWKDDPLLQGWPFASSDSDADSCNCAAWFNKAVGLLLTALAICMGAPFWFDLLNRFGSLRNAIQPPKTGHNAPTEETAK